MIIRSEGQFLSLQFTYLQGIYMYTQKSICKHWIIVEWHREISMNIAEEQRIDHISTVTQKYIHTGDTISIIMGCIYWFWFYGWRNIPCYQYVRCSMMIMTLGTTLARAVFIIHKWAERLRSYKILYSDCQIYTTI